MNKNTYTKNIQKIYNPPYKKDAKNIQKIDQKQTKNMTK